jgi:hypothetical protein
MGGVAKRLTLNCKDATLLKRLEAAIGIELINKGFAVKPDVFAQVPRCSLVLIFVGACDIFSLRLITYIWAFCDRL